MEVKQRKSSMCRVPVSSGRYLLTGEGSLHMIRASIEADRPKVIDDS